MKKLITLLLAFATVFTFGLTAASAEVDVPVSSSSDFSGTVGVEGEWAFQTDGWPTAQTGNDRVEWYLTTGNTVKQGEYYYLNFSDTDISSWVDPSTPLPEGVSLRAEPCIAVDDTLPYDFGALYWDFSFTGTPTKACSSKLPKITIPKEYLAYSTNGGGSWNPATTDLTIDLGAKLGNWNITNAPAPAVDVPVSSSSDFSGTVGVEGQWQFQTDATPTTQQTGNDRVVWRFTTENTMEEDGRYLLDFSYSVINGWVDKSTPLPEGIDLVALPTLWASGGLPKNWRSFYHAFKFTGTPTKNCSSPLPKITIPYKYLAYSKDGGKTWTPATEGQDLVIDLGAKLGNWNITGEPEPVPETGDNTPILLTAGLLLLSGAALIALRKRGAR